MKKGSRGFASIDAAIALALIAMILLVGSSTLLSARGRSHEKACLAIRIAGALASNCVGEGGVSKCEGGYLLSNELGEADYAALSAEYSEKVNESVVVFNGSAPGGACAYRLYYRDGVIVRAGACVN